MDWLKPLIEWLRDIGKYLSGAVVMWVIQDRGRMYEQLDTIKKREAARERLDAMPDEQLADVMRNAAKKRGQRV